MTEKENTPAGVQPPPAIQAVRGGLWVASFYVVALLGKVYLEARPALANSIHILALGIFFGDVCVAAILWQSRGEKNFRKQVKHLVSAGVLVSIVYGLCCLLYFSFTGDWAWLYLRF